MCSSESPNHSRHFPECRDFLSASSIAAIIHSRFDSTSCGDLAAIHPMACTNKRIYQDNAYSNDAEMYPSDRCIQLRYGRRGAIPLNFVQSIFVHASFLNRDFTWQACERKDDHMRNLRQSVHRSLCPHPRIFVSFFPELARETNKNRHNLPLIMFSIPSQAREPDSVRMREPHRCVHVVSVPSKGFCRVDPCSIETTCKQPNGYVCKLCRASR